MLRPALLLLCLPCSAAVLVAPKGREGRDSAAASASASAPHPQHLGFLGLVNATRGAAEAAGRPVLARLQKQAEYEFSFSQSKTADVSTVNKVVLICLSSFFGICGCDRCFVGSYITGMLKFCSVGGFGIWAMVDYMIVTLNCLCEEPSINSIGMHANFSEKSVKPAYFMAIICFVYHVIMAVKNGGSTERRQQSVAMMPMTFSRKLREGGLLAARPSVPELQALFKQLDTDGNGLLDKSELKTGLADLGCPDYEIEAMLRQADLDGDGQINPTEFIAALGGDASAAKSA